MPGGCRVLLFMLLSRIASDDKGRTYTSFGGLDRNGEWAKSPSLWRPQGYVEPAWAREATGGKGGAAAGGR